MAVLTASDEPEVLAADSPAGPALRLSRRGDKGRRTVPLSSGKNTIGSSPQCQVCLSSPEVRPLQCVVTLESNTASVTRWAAGVQLNGNEFSKADLNDGDRLTIGEWEIAFDRCGSTYIEPAACDDREFLPDDELDSPPESTAEVALREEGKPEGPESLPATPLASMPETAPPLVEQPALVEAAPAKPAKCHSSQMFADSLVLLLWTANDRARRRAKALITGLRAARFHADALAADLSAMETELNLARAAYDSHLGSDDRLQQELTEKHEQRVAPLVEEIAALKSQLDEAQAQVSRQTTEFETLSDELTARQNSAQTPSVGSALAKRAEELEAAVAVHSQELEKVADELRLAYQKQERLADRYHREAERASQLEPQLSERQAEIAAAADQPRAAESATPTSAPEDLRRDDAPPLVEPVAKPNSLSSPVASYVEPEVAPGTLATLQSEFEQYTIGEQPAAEFAPTSFIDKYRHLLQDDDAQGPRTLGPKGDGPIIDDEFLSPDNVETCAVPADESDDALEAYMANMMRRVRSSSPSYESSQAVSEVEFNSARAGDSGNQSGDPTAYPVDAATAADLIAEEPLSLDAMKQATRKQPLASDLASLREIANSTARAAIATYSQGRRRESSITKIAIALMAVASAAYLMTSAPAYDYGQFWAGVATGAVGIAVATQAMITQRRRTANRAE